MTRVVPPLPSVVALVLLVSACSPDADHAPLSVQEGTENGVRVTRFAGAIPTHHVDLDRHAVRFSPEPSGIDGEFVLYRASYFTALPDGSMAFANRGTNQIAVLTEDGRLAATFGRAGDGPGEFRQIASLAFCRASSRLAVFGRDRVTWLNVTLGSDSVVEVDLDETEVIRGGEDVQFFRQRTSLIGLDSECRPVYHLRALPDSDPTTHRQRDELWIMDGRDSESVLRLPTRRPAEGRAVVFAPRLRYEVTSEGIAYAGGDSAVVSIFDVDGRSTRVLRWADDLGPVPAEEWERAAALYSEEVARRGSPPPHRPVVGDLVADPACACLLVRRFTLPNVDASGYSPPNDWLLFRFGSSPSATELRFPTSASRVLATERGIWAVGTDPLGVETIYRLPLPDVGAR